MKRLLILISILMAVGLAAPKAQFQTPRPGSGGGSGTPTAHATSHQNGGTDEINVGGLSGTLADPQTPAAHKTAHENGGADEISVAGLSGLLADLQNAIAHALSHQNGGGDEISVTGLSGLLADAQNPIAHASRHATLGADPLALSDIYAGTSCTNQLLRVLNGLGAGTCATVTSAYVDSSIALTGGKLSQFAATTSAELAGVLSDEQGSGGGFVRATSPTLTTPNLGVPSAIDLTNATHSGATAGRAYFAGASGILSGDTGFVWDNSNKRLVLASGGQTLDAAGLTTAFHIGGDSPAPGIMLLDGYGAPPTIYMRRASGTQASKTAPTNGVASFLLGGKVWDGSAWADSAFMRLSSDGDTTGSNHGGLFDIYLTPNGSTAAPTDALRVTTDALSVGMQLGTVATTGVIRIPNDQYLYSRGGTAINVKMLGVTPSNAVAIGDNARTNQIGEVWETEPGNGDFRPVSSAARDLGGSTRIIRNTYSAKLTSPPQTTTSTGNQAAFAVTSSWLRANNATTITFQGIAAGADGQELDITSVGAGTVDITNSNGSASAANQILTGTGATVTLAAGTGNAKLRYDGTTAKWRLMFVR